MGHFPSLDEESLHYIFRVGGARLEELLSMLSHTGVGRVFGSVEIVAVDAFRKGVTAGGSEGGSKSLRGTESTTDVRDKEEEDADTTS